MVTSIEKYKDLEEMCYSEFVAFVEETNRPSGGIKSIQTVVANAANLNEESSILEIGSTTGFTSINLAYLTKAKKIIGIDINSEAVYRAKMRSKRENLDDRIEFMVGDARKLSFRDNSFDLA